MSFKIKYTENFTPNSGLITQFTWQNKEFQQAIAQFVNLRNHEELTGLTIGVDGVQVHLKTITKKEKGK